MFPAHCQGQLLYPTTSQGKIWVSLFSGKMMRTMMVKVAIHGWTKNRVARQGTFGEV
jgi:hypothetical protein